MEDKMREQRGIFGLLLCGMLGMVLVCAIVPGRAVAEPVDEDAMAEEVMTTDLAAESEADDGLEAEATPSVQYFVHRQTYGNEAKFSKRDGQVSGTTGKSKRLEAIWVRLANRPVSGGIQYRTHVQSYGWMGWKSDGAMSGTRGESKRLEAIQIRLTGQMAKRYDVYYRVHAQKFSWMGWAKNGASAGTAGYAYRLEAIQIRLVRKGGKAPGSTANAFRQNVNAAAHAAYARIAKSLARSFGGGVYRYANIYGNATNEMLTVTKETSGSGSTLRIYTYSGGKARLMLKTGVYGDVNYKFYKGSSSFILHAGGHGGERYRYFKASGGTYKEIASTGRVTRLYGGSYDGPWTYYVSSNRQVTRQAYLNAISGVAKGKAVTINGSHTWSRIR